MITVKAIAIANKSDDTVCFMATAVARDTTTAE